MFRTEIICAARDTLVCGSASKLEIRSSQCSAALTLVCSQTNVFANGDKPFACVSEAMHSLGDIHEQVTNSNVIVHMEDG